MSTENNTGDQATTTNQNGDQAQSAEGTDTDTQTTDTAAEIEKWKNLARKHEERAKANAQAAKELEEVRKQNMTEQERAVEEARIAARAEALAEVGAQLVDAEIRAVAAGRLSEAQLKTLFQGLNRSAFLKDDGTVDTESVKNFVDGIAPKTDESGKPSFNDVGQGARGNMNNALNGDPLLRDLKKALGISG